MKEIDTAARTVLAIAAATKGVIWLLKEKNRNWLKRTIERTKTGWKGYKAKRRKRQGPQRITPAKAQRWHVIIAKPRFAGGSIKTKYANDTHTENRSYIIGTIWTGPKGNGDEQIRRTKSRLLARGVSPIEIEKYIEYEIRTFDTKENIPKEEEPTIAYSDNGVG